MNRNMVVLLVVAAVMAFSSVALAKRGKTRFAKQGTITGAGLVNFTKSSDEPDEGEETDTTFFRLHPEVGFFVLDGLNINLEPTLALTKADDSDTNEYGIRGGVDYYYPLQGTLFIKGGGYLGYFTSTTTINETDAETDDGGLEFGFNIGLTLAFGSKYGGFASLDAFFGYKNYDIETEETEIGHTITDLGLMTGLGVFF